MIYFEETKKYKRNRDFGCFIIGCLSVLFISYFGYFLSNVTNILINPDIFIIYYPLIFTIIVVTLLNKFINNNIVPDLFFIKGTFFMFVLNILNKVISPVYFLNGKIDNLSNLISYFFVVYIAPSLVYFLFLMITYYFQSIRLKYINLKKGDYDKIIEQNNQIYEKQKKNKQINKNIKNDNTKEISNDISPDVFDSAGNFIKKLSEKIENNIKGDKK